MTGRHVVVPRARGTARLPPLLDRHRHVVGRMHLCGDGHARHPALPWRLGNRPNLQDLPVSALLSLDAPLCLLGRQIADVIDLFVDA